MRQDREHEWEPHGINTRCRRCGTVSLGPQFMWLIGPCVLKRKPTKRATRSRNKN